ncbi:MAG: glycosyltransferase [Anaerolineae bacterium]|nr:glycosyltransferase [Anaerolineae bacterium]
MLTGQHILCFGPDRWGSIWQDKPGLMRALARHNRVVYFEPRPHLPDVLRDLRAGRVGWRDLRRPRLERITASLYVYHHPLYAPISGREPLRTPLRWLREALWGRSLRQLGIHHPILWLYLPGMLDLVGHFNERLLVYFVVDEYAAYPGLKPEVAASMRRREEAMLRRADLVFTTAATLRDERLPLNPHTYWVPNAVDSAAFAAVLGEPRSEPSFLASLPRPRLGIVGSIGSKVDYELLAAVAQARPGWSLTLVGPVVPGADTHKLNALRLLPNVYLLGAVPPAKVPHVMRACDVGLIPYIASPETHHVNPLKVYEYLAVGLPVVSTPLPNLAVPSEMAHTGDTPSAFIAAIEAALAETGDEFAARRRAYASTQTWDARAEEISRRMEESLARKEREKRFRVLDRIQERTGQEVDPEEVEHVVNEEIHALRQERRQAAQEEEKDADIL